MSLDRDLANYSQAGAAKLCLEFLDSHFDGVQTRIDNEIFHKLDNGFAIGADEALHFVYMKHANYLLMKRLTAKLAAGRNAGARIAPVLNQGA